MSGLTAAWLRGANPQNQGPEAGPRQPSTASQGTACTELAQSRSASESLSPVPEERVSLQCSWLPARSTVRWFMQGMATIASHVVCLLILFLARKYSWITMLSLLFGIDAYAAWRTCRRRQLVDETAFWSQGFDTFIGGIPFALCSFYACYLINPGHSHDCMWFITVPEPVLMRICLGISGCLSIGALAMGSVEIDQRAGAAVFERIEGSQIYLGWHLLFRSTELLWRITSVVLYCELSRPLMPAIAMGPVVLLIPSIVIYLIYYLALLWAGRTPGDAPSADGMASFARALWGSPAVHPDSKRACAVVAYVAQGMNPVFFMDCPGFANIARRANRAMRCINFVEIGVLLLLMLVSWDLPFPDNQCQNLEDFRIGQWIVHRHPVLLVNIFTCMVIHYSILLLHPSIRQPWCESGRELALRFALTMNREEPAAQAQVQGTPPVGMCQLLVTLGSRGQGAVSSFTPAGDSSFLEAQNGYSVIRQLGEGSFGVVVLVRQDMQLGSYLPVSQRQYYALKLQNTEEANAVENRPTLHEIVHREQSIYERIWQQDPASRKRGHPYIVRLVCSCPWPEGRPFFNQDTGAPVAFKRAHTLFNHGLLMEYCEMSLEQFIEDRMKQGESDRTLADSLRWLELIRRFSAQILLALEFLHGKHIYYRDLKPGNALVVRGGKDAKGNQLWNAKLGDFGHSKIVTDEDPANSLSGTPYFCAPEMEAIMGSRERLQEVRWDPYLREALTLQAMGRRYQSASQQVYEYFQTCQPVQDTNWSLDVFSFGMLLWVMAFGCYQLRPGDRWYKPYHGPYLVRPGKSLLITRRADNQAHLVNYLASVGGSQWRMYDDGREFVTLECNTARTAQQAMVALRPVLQTYYGSEMYLARKGAVGVDGTERIVLPDDHFVRLQAQSRFTQALATLISDATADDRVYRPQVRQMRSSAFFSERISIEGVRRTLPPINWQALLGGGADDVAAVP